jgi:hypothetical protein
MRRTHDHAAHGKKPEDAPPSSSLLVPGEATPINVNRSGLAKAVPRSRPRNRRERLARLKMLRELAAGKHR